MDYMTRTCLACAHLEMSEVRPDTSREYTCREQLHVIGMPTPRGLVQISVYAKVKEDMPACSRFVERQGDAFERALPVVQPGDGQKRLLIA